MASAERAPLVGTQGVTRHTVGLAPASSGTGLSFMMPPEALGGDIELSVLSFTLSGLEPSDTPDATGVAVHRSLRPDQVTVQLETLSQRALARRILVRVLDDFMSEVVSRYAH